MADGFGPRLRVLLADKGVSMRAAARSLNYDVAYLSRVINGRQHPSGQLARALDELLGTDGELLSLAVRDAPSPVSEHPPGPTAEIERMKAGAAYLLDHADRHGGDTVAPAAVQVWQSAQRKLDSGEIPESDQSRYLSAVSEAAEVAGWLLFDAGKFTSARAAFLESHMLARHAGDRKMQWFALDMLAMVDTECCRPGETRRVAEELLSQRRTPPRVALLARMRRGRALAQMGDRQRALSDLEAARGGLEDSLTARDPEWAWWVNTCEVTGHSGQALLDLGHPEAAMSEFRSSLQHATPRGAMLYRAELLRCHVAVKAWRAAEAELEEISALLDDIHSGRNRRSVHQSLKAVHRESGVPSVLASLASETESRLRTFEVA
ncbi:helix-turn-helix domain-containing protein [Streptomyces graminilatus]|uniref:helix-turn-helix domain-containing protein n=1 Tax=Streptomyces graminilatus TaxID=1464070 RepID=UPI00099ED5A4|nr:helix-turn-helix transcriptional regulator [Streptomyces graminilatus]